MKAFLKWLSARFPSSMIEVRQSHKVFSSTDTIKTQYRCYVSGHDIFSFTNVKNKTPWSDEVDTIAELKFEVNQYLKVKKEEELKANNDE
jgi:hypothetical protein